MTNMAIINHIKHLYDNHKLDEGAAIAELQDFAFDAGSDEWETQIDTMVGQGQSFLAIYSYFAALFKDGDHHAD